MTVMLKNINGVHRKHGTFSPDSRTSYLAWRFVESGVTFPEFQSLLRHQLMLYIITPYPNPSFLTLGFRSFIAVLFGSFK
jgi:hypothetical protein